MGADEDCVMKCLVLADDTARLAFKEVGVFEKNNFTVFWQRVGDKNDIEFIDYNNSFFFDWGNNSSSGIGGERKV